MRGFWADDNLKCTGCRAHWGTRAKQGDSDADSSFTEKPWSVTPSTMTCRMTLSVSLPATPMQPSLKMCISLKTVSFLQ